MRDRGDAVGAVADARFFFRPVASHFPEGDADYRAFCGI